MKKNNKNMNKKKNKKLTILLLLLLIGIICGTGFGIYAYYYTTGTIHTAEETISIASFNPEIHYANDNDYHFLHGSHYTGDEVNCTFDSYNSSTQTGTYTCVSNIIVRNNGSSDIEIDLDNLSLLSTGSDTGNITIGTATYTHTNSTNQIAANGNDTYTLSATVQISGLSSDPSQVSDDAQYTSTPINGADITVHFECDVTATQVHE